MSEEEMGEAAQTSVIATTSSPTQSIVLMRHNSREILRKWLKTTRDLVYARRLDPSV